MSHLYASLPASILALHSPPPQILISGVGFFSDAYVLFVINLVKNVLGLLYPIDDKSQETSLTSAVASAALAGAVVGQLVFGALADKLGRRLIFVATISFVCLGSLGSATCVAHPDHASLYIQLTCWQFLLGVGIGGEYPLSATVTSENAGHEGRGSAVATVFSMQGVGNLVSCLIMWGGLSTLQIDLDIVWRLALGIGAMPGLCTVYFRWKMSESKHFKRMQARDRAHSRALHDEDDLAAIAAAADSGASAPVAAHKPDSALLASHPSPHPGVPAMSQLRRTLAVLRDFKWVLLGTAGSWFIFDVVFYANSLFSGTVLRNADSDLGGDPTRSSLADTAMYSSIIAAIGLPGYWLAVYVVDKIGRKPLQLIGFVCMALVYTCMAAALNAMRDANLGWLFVLLYGLTFFFSNFGPNTSTFVIPAEAFPTRARATCHGLSAASGKLGGAIGAAAMDSVKGNVRLVLILAAVISVVGCIWTLIFTKETLGQSLSSLDAAAEHDIDDVEEKQRRELDPQRAQSMDMAKMPREHEPSVKAPLLGDV